MTFGLRSLGARSSGRKEPSGRRHRLQTAMASLPQNESMGKILRDVCCKLLSSALLRSDGESVFMLTAQSGDVRFFCSLLHLTTWSWNWTWCCGSNWARELRAKQSQMAQKAETKTWSEQGEFTVHSSNFWTCLVPDLDLAPPSSLGFLTVSQRHCQSAEKKKNGRNASRSVSTCPEIHGIRKRGAPIILITSHHTKQKKEPGATALQPLQDDQPLPAFPEHCTLGPGGGDESSNATKAVRNQACAFGASCRHWQLPKILEPFQGIFVVFVPRIQQQKSCTNARKHTRNHQKSRWRETVGSVTTDPEWWCKGQAAASTVQNAGSHIEFFVLSPMLQINCDHRALLGLCLATSSCFFGVACFFANAWISTPESTWGPNAFGHTSLSNWQCHGARTREVV